MVVGLKEPSHQLLDFKTLLEIEIKLLASL